MSCNYDGNPPKSQSEQNDRFLNVFSVAMNNKKYHRNYYEGNLRESEEYKKMILAIMYHICIYHIT